MAIVPDGADPVAPVCVAIVGPPAACLGCLAEAGQPFPVGITSRLCPRCLAHTRRVWQCQQWNTDPRHQSVAGQASFTAFSARRRASQGLPPLSVEAARRYVTPDHIRAELGLILPARLQVIIHRTWCAGLLLPVAAWLGDDPPPEPDGLGVSSSEAGPEPGQRPSS